METDGPSAETDPKVAAMATIPARASPPSSFMELLIARAPVFIWILVFSFVILVSSSFADLFRDLFSLAAGLFIRLLLVEVFMLFPSSICCSPNLITAGRHAIERFAYL